MRVLLLRPNSRMLITPPPLGLGFVAGALRRARDDDVLILDAHARHLSDARLAARIRDFAPQVVGITATDFENVRVGEMAAIAKAQAPSARVVLGGPLVTAHRTRILSDPNVDFGVVGEGEVTAVELLDALDGGGDLSRVPGLVFRENGEGVFTGERPFIQDLDPVRPAWDLLNPRLYMSRVRHTAINRLRRSHRALPLFTSRGCPYGCIYCHNIFGKKFRAQSPRAVVDEVLYLRDRFGVRELDFTDDIFNADPERARQILTGIRDEAPGLDLAFPNGLRADRMDDSLLDLFVQAGTYHVAYAVETATPRLQKLIRKSLDLEKAMAIISSTARRGVLTHGFFMMGFPTETVNEMRKTSDLACASRLHAALFFFVNHFAGTRLARMTGR
ncbi:MAG: radical SAM protein, partial [Pseudomonadota bacterium]